MLYFCFVIFVYFYFLYTAVAINCYQCSGSDPTQPFQCNEWLSSDIDIKPEPCDSVYDAKYCIKHTGRFEGTAYRVSAGKTYLTKPKFTK